MRISQLFAQTSQPLLFDGACGTYYRNLTHSDTACELANLEQPQLIKKIHLDYLAAGAQVLSSNTFAANFDLTTDEAQLQEIIAAGLALAREAAAGEAAVLADLGPINGGAGEEETAAAYLRLVELFLAAGAADFLFETQAEFAALRPALAYLQEHKPDAYILVSFAVSQDGYSKKGYYYKDLLQEAFATANVAAGGLNCICGPGHILKLLRDLPQPAKPLLAQPNAGYPLLVNQRIVYEDNVDYFAERMLEIVALDCRFVGGCCGTTPQHIACLQARLAGRRAGQTTAPAQPAQAAPRTGQPTRPHDAFWQKLHADAPVAVVELNPPLGADVAQFVTAARKAAAAGADIISITDSPLARVRADSMMLAAKLRRELGLEVLPHLSCRDRNRLGLQATLLAAAIEDIRYLLAVRGDAVDEGVFQLNSRQLIGFITSLNREQLGERAIQVGGALNLNAPNFAAELRRAQAKAEAGCQYFLTQPIYEESALAHLAQAYETLAQPIVTGILPLVSYKNAAFLNHEVGGITIPKPVLTTLQALAPAEIKDYSLAESMRLMREARPYSAGYYLMTPLNKIDWICTLVEVINQL